VKTLYIVRHAKSSWDFPNLRDHDRPLLPKGEKRTRKIAVFLEKENIKPDLMISSTAVRAYETAVIIAKQLGYPVKNIISESKFYDSGILSIMDVLYGLDNKVNSVMIFGHNPSFTSLANKFLHNPIEWLPTSGLVSISFDAEKWEEILLVERKTNFVIFPKMLR
jgi:phosphohistidine phosphatase